MTLVLSLVTPEFACHVSDRQLTNGLTGRPLISRAAKTVVAPQPKFMVSYTGLAWITPRMSTDEWLMRTLWELRDSPDYFGSLAAAATDAFAKMPLPAKFKRHGFLISGWIGDDEIAVDSPAPLGFVPNAYSAYITNTLDLEAGIELREAGEQFVHRTRPLYPNDRFHVFAAGASLTPEETVNLENGVASALRSRGGGEKAAAMVMVRTVETVASRDSTVGGGTFVCAIPSTFSAATVSEDAAGLTVLGMRWGLPMHGTATFLHIPDRPTNRVESPAIIADPFAGRAQLIVHKGNVPTVAGAGDVPEEAEIHLRLVALRSSDEIASLFSDP